jgi:hypothetical protein
LTDAPQTPAEAAPPPKGVSRRDWRRVIRWARLGDYALEVVSLGLVVAFAIGFGSYAGRRLLVGELAEAYLRQRGVEAEVRVLDVDARGFVGRVRLGPSADPDFTAERVEVLLAAPPPPEGPYALRPRTIRIVRPSVKARWTGERLSLGALDPLVEEALSRPPQEDQPGPRVLIEDGALRLLTPYGRLAASGSGVVDDNRLEQLNLALQPASLKSGAGSTELGGGTVRLRTVGESLQLALDLRLERLQADVGAAESARFSASGRAPYPDLKNRRLEGPLDITLGLQGRNLILGAVKVQGAGPERLRARRPVRPF